MNIKNIFAAALFSGVLATSAAQAALITVTPSASTVQAGQTFQVTIVGQDWTEGEGGTYGGGLSLSWDASVLNLQSYDTSVFAGDQALASSNTTTVIDNVNGQLRNLSVASLFDGVYTADFDIAVLTFTALSAGQTNLDLMLGLFDNGFANIWTDSSFANAIQVNPEFVSGHVDAVPVPAAAWLFGSALLAGAGLARRKQA